MKRFITLTLAGALALSLTACGGGSPAEKKGEVNVYNWGEYIDESIFSDFTAQFVPMTIIGRYQLMCGVPTDEWAMHVTLRDAETEEVVAEGGFPMEE